MEVSSDPYELKLYQMFESCDTDRCGLLNQDALHRLCSLLELRDKGAVLIENLAASGKKQHISFECFKEALLNFLGTELDGKETTVTTTKFQQGQCQNTFNGDCERVLVISNEENSYVDSPADTSDREVSPKLVVGTKKYGRRSRPQQHITDEFSLSDSEENDMGEVQRCNIYSRNVVQRSSSQTDIPGTRCRRFTPLNGNKLKRCSSLPAQKTPKTITVKSKTVLATNKSTQLTVPQNPILSKENEQKQLNSSVESLDAPNLMDTISKHTIIDIWERANIANGKGILAALGFDDDEINLAQLNKVLDEEVRSLEDDQEMVLLRAALALQGAELITLRQTLRQFYDENVKLRADNKDANRRVAMLAVEIDERHATLEDTSKKEIRMLEQRHSAAVRDLTTRMVNDRENWTNLTARLEARIKIFEQEEIRIKTELDLVRKENSDLENEQKKLSKEVTELSEKNAHLNREINNLKERGTCEEQSFSTVGKGSHDEVMRLVEKIDSLQFENTSLRDKSDELVAEIENLNMELQRIKAKSNKKTTVSFAAVNCQLTDEILLEESEHGNNLTAVKRRGDSPSKTRITGESPRLGKLRRCGTEPGGSENSDTSGEWMALNSELQNSDADKQTNNQSSTEALMLKEQVASLEMQLKNLQASSTKNLSEERCKELETSLEQMQRAYEDCEDYWQSKLSEERQLFEKERQIYEEEQQESDKKFTELMEKVREYEEQFSKDGRLSPIEEKDTLEQQYADLEAEAEEIRDSARKVFEEKSKEIEALQTEIEDLRMRLGESVEILTGACELNGEVMVVNTTSNINANTQSSASSPISYLWHQSTIQEPNKHCHSLENSAIINTSSFMGNQDKPLNRNNLSTSAMAIFSTTPIDACIVPDDSPQTVSPIQKPNRSKIIKSDCEADNGETSSTSSERCFETHSITSTQSANRSQILNPGTSTVFSSQENSCSSNSGLKKELKRLKFFELSLKEQIKDLSLQRDGLVMELQQLQEARPVLEKAYARTAHPTLMQRVNQLELKNRHLQNVIKQQQQYTETLMQQSWRQHQMELSDLHNRIEAQTAMLTEQTQRLQNADLLVKDLYVENSNLAATVQRLEQQRARTHQLHQQRQTINSLPGIP